MPHFFLPLHEKKKVSPEKSKSKADISHGFYTTQTTQINVNVNINTRDTRFMSGRSKR